jgi:sialate O-acetylesterase
MIKLPAIFGNGMVLQRDSEVAIWGWAEANAEVRVDFRGERRRARADGSGNWSVTVGPYPAGGPYTLQIVGEESVTLQDILIGDIWLA